jgi:hypothetical protein
MVVITPTNVEAVSTAKMGSVVIVCNAAMFVAISTFLPGLGLNPAMDCTHLGLLRACLPSMLLGPIDHRRLRSGSTLALLLCWSPLLLCGPPLLLCGPRLLLCGSPLLRMLAPSPFLPCIGGSRAAEKKKHCCGWNRESHMCHLWMHTSGTTSSIEGRSLSAWLLLERFERILEVAPSGLNAHFEVVPLLAIRGSEGIQLALHDFALVLDVINLLAIVCRDYVAGHVSLGHQLVELRAQLSESCLDLSYLLSCCVHAMLSFLVVLVALVASTKW